MKSSGLGLAAPEARHLVAKVEQGAQAHADLDEDRRHQARAQQDEHRSGRGDSNCCHSGQADFHAFYRDARFTDRDTRGADVESDPAGCIQSDGTPGADGDVSRHIQSLIASDRGRLVSSHLGGHVIFDDDLVILLGVQIHLLRALAVLEAELISRVAILRAARLHSALGSLRGQVVVHGPLAAEEPGARRRFRRLLLLVCQHQ